MDLRLVLSSFFTVFLAELGDKTQIATFCFAAEGGSRLSVFLGSAGALVLSSFIAVLLGCEINRFISPQVIKSSAGVLFILMGIWMILFSGR